MTIINKNNNKYNKILKTRNKKDLFNYLKNREFNNYLEPYEETESYELYRHIEDNIPIEDKAKDLIYIIALLHNKTTTYEKYGIDDVKELYELQKTKIYKLKEYYYSLHDKIENQIYYYPEEYLLLKNISLIYKLLSKSEELLEEWYKSQIKETKVRKCTLHRNLTLKKIKEEDNKIYLIDWDNYSKDLVIYDFIIFYKNEYKILEMTSLYDLYLSKYPLTKTEQLLLYSNLSLPKQVLLNKSHYENTINIKYLITYATNTLNFISKYDEKNK